MQRGDGGALRRTLSNPKGQRDHETCANFVKLWWNLGETKLGEPGWNLGETLVEPSAEPFGSPRRICPRKPERPRSLSNLGTTLAKLWWNPGGTHGGGTLGGTLVEEPWWKPWWNLAGTFLGKTLVEPWWNPWWWNPWWNLPQNLLGLNTDLPPRTMESPKAILPRNLYYD